LAHARPSIWTSSPRFLTALPHRASSRRFRPSDVPQQPPASPLLHTKPATPPCCRESISPSAAALAPNGTVAPPLCCAKDNTPLCRFTAALFASLLCHDTTITPLLLCSSSRPLTSPYCHATIMPPVRRPYTVRHRVSPVRRTSLAVLRPLPRRDHREQGTEGTRPPTGPRPTWLDST
jgi:hypothetical protein